jgi:nitronate monooxygenase
VARLRTPLCDLLGIEVPIVLAGMAGGSTTPELVAAVSEAGGLGTFGAMGMPLDRLGEAVERAHALTRGPIGVNVLVASAIATDEDLGPVRAAVGGMRAELGLPAAEPAPGPPAPTPAESVRVGLEAGASVVSVGLGDPAPVADLARAAGAPLIAMAATVEDAVRAVASGADAVVAQGGEAGGHRSNFRVAPDGSVPLVGTLALVPQVVDAVDVPVIAAGGIMDGRGVAAALALGAAGAQLGTRFLVSEEAGVPPGYKRRVLAAADTETVVTMALSGRPARGLRNRLIAEMEGAGANAGYPHQAGLTAGLRAAAAAADREDLLPLWAGQAAGLAEGTLPAAEIVAALVAETTAVIARLGRTAGSGA